MKSAEHAETTTDDSSSIPSIDAVTGQSVDGTSVDVATRTQRAATAREFVERNEPRNLLCMAGHHVLLRIGWIFKTESVVMPAFFDAIAPGAWAGTLRGFLPVLNRIGQSIPPLLFARRLAALPRKKLALFCFSTCMGLAFITLALLLLAGVGVGSLWLPILFLAIYAFFFSCVGLGNLSFATLQGKLIRPTHRGRLLTLHTVLGVVGATSAAFFLMSRWLRDNTPAEFGVLFLFTGGCFLVATVFALATREPSDDHPAEPRMGIRGTFAAALSLPRTDPNFGRLASVAMLFGTALMLFPHYQALARERLTLQGSALVGWVIVQNLGIGVCSLLIGPLADRRGYRLTMRVGIFLTVVAPISAVVISHLDPEIGRRLFWIVFIPVGLTPLSMKSMNNYALEISSQRDHPRYLSTLSLCMALPFVFSPVVGWLVTAIGFDAVFLGIAALLLISGLLTFRLKEPRHHPEFSDAENWDE